MNRAAEVAAGVETAVVMPDTGQLQCSRTWYLTHSLKPL